jgi:hypothetical protein
LERGLGVRLKKSLSKMERDLGRGYIAKKSLS